jgi:cytoskeletal protein CcmA (bactofilin family)
VDSAIENLDTWSASSYRGAKYFISVNAEGITELANLEAVVVHNGSDAYITIYNEINTGNNSLITLTADVSGGLVRLRGTGNTPNLRVTMYRILLGDSETTATGDNTKTVGASSVSSSATSIDTFSTESFTGAQYVVVGYNSAEGAASISEVHVVTDGSDAYVSSGPIVSTKGSDQLTFTAALSGTTVTLSAASTSGSSTTVNAFRVSLLRTSAGASTSETVLISPAQTITGQKTFSSEVLLNSISSIDSTAVQINDGLTVSGALTANTIQTNNISSSESSAIQINDGMNISGSLTANTLKTDSTATISGTLTANTIVTNDISSADSTAVQINDGVNVGGTLTANTFVTNNISSSESSAIQINDSVNVGGTLTAASIAIDGKQAVNGPAFSAYAEATLQTITSGSQQKVLFQVEEFDTNNNYASSRFTPTVAGYYQLNAEVRLDGASGTGEMMIVIWKNGAEYKRGTNQQGTQIAANFWAMQVSSVVYANGTGDYFEIYVQQGSGGSVTVTAVNVPYITWFNGCMIRGA